MRQRGIKPIVVQAILSGYCNTSRDVADETGLSVKRCSACIHALVDIGVIRRTERALPRSGKGGKFLVFEVAA